MDWVHCNSCFLLPDSEKSFFLTSCGHIYCKDCEEQCARSKCKLCGNQCSTIALSSTMKPDVQVYFTDPEDLLKKKLKEIHQVTEFQKNHRARLMAHQRKQLKKCKSLKEDFRKLLKNIKDLDGERRMLLQENDSLKKYINMQRALSHNSSRKGDKGNMRSSYEVSPSSNIESVLSKYAEKFANGKSPPTTSQRMCVISPPKDGKLGIIEASPSPSSALRNLNLSARYTNESLHKRQGSQFETPSTPGSAVSNFSNFVTPQSNSTSPADTFLSPNDTRRKYLREERKRLVVHPFSPND